MECYHRKAKSGSLYLVPKKSILWQSKNYSIIALRTCQGEYIAVSRTVHHTLGINLLYDNNHGRKTQAMIFYLDSANAIKTTQHHLKTNFRIDRPVALLPPSSRKIYRRLFEAHNRLGETSRHNEERNIPSSIQNGDC